MRELRFPLVLLACALCAGRADAERWVEVRSEHFRVLTDAGEGQGRKVATGFEQVRRLFLGLGARRVDPAGPIVVVAASGEEQMRSLLPSFWERRHGMRPAGVFLTTGDAETPFVVLRLDIGPEYRDHVVFHEYVHHIARNSISGLPLWLSEGLADFYAGTSVRDQEVLYGRADPNHVHLLRSRPLLPLAKLLAVDAGSREYNDADWVALMYAESALLTHFLLVGDKGVRNPMLMEYMRLLADGVPPQQAQVRAFGDLGALEEAFRRYVRQMGFPAIKAPLDLSGAAPSVREIGDAEVAAERGDLLVRFGPEKDARAVLAKARELNPNLALAAQPLGRLESRAGHGAEARRLLAEAIRLAPDDFLSHYLWARAIPLSDPAVDLAATEAATRRALELKPEFAPAHALLSAVLRKRGRLEPAFVALHQACELDRNNTWYWAQRADLLRDLGKPDVADAIEKELARTAPSDPTRLALLAGYYRGEKRFSDAEKLLATAAELNPQSARPLMMLGQHLAGVGRGDDAEAAFRRALALQPDNPTIQNDLAYHNADRGVKLDESLKLVERALRAYPQDGSLLDTKGWVLFRMGRLDEAERLIRQALERDDGAALLEHLGDVLDKRGAAAEARQMWRRALDSPDVEEDHKPQLRRKLGETADPPADPPAGTASGTAPKPDAP